MKCRNSRVDLVPIQDAQSLNLERRIVLEGAHGEEIVRSIIVDETVRNAAEHPVPFTYNLQHGTIFTAGEDGQIKAFRATERLPVEITSPISSKSKKAAGGRYKPY